MKRFSVSVVFAIQSLAVAQPSVQGQQAVLTLSSAESTPQQRDDAEAFILAEKSAELLPVLFYSLDDSVPGDLTVQTIYHHGGGSLVPWDAMVPPLSAQVGLAGEWTVSGWIVAHRVRVWRELAKTAEPVGDRYQQLAQLGAVASGIVQWRELILAWGRCMHATEERVSIEQAMRSAVADITMDREDRRSLFILLCPDGPYHSRRDRNFEFVVRMLWAERGDPNYTWGRDSLWLVGQTGRADDRHTPILDPRVMTLAIEKMQRDQLNGIQYDNHGLWEMGVILGLELPEGFHRDNVALMRGAPSEAVQQQIETWIEEHGAQTAVQAQALNDAGNP